MVSLINIGMSNILNDQIKQLAYNFGKELAASANKHFAAQMAGGYTETLGRGGSGANGMGGDGSIPAAKKLNQEVDDLSKSIHQSTNVIGNAVHRVGQFGKSIVGLMSKGGLDSVVNAHMQSIMTETQDMVNAQSGMYRELAQSTLDYITGSGTNLEALSGVTDSLEDFNKELHKAISQGKVDSQQGHEIWKRLQKIYKEDGETRIELTKMLSATEREHLGKLFSRGAELSDEDAADPEKVKAYNEQMNALKKLSEVTVNTANVIAATGSSAVNTINESIDHYRSKMLIALRVAGASAATGFYQLYSDAITRYRTGVDRTFIDLGMTSAAMGMSVDETLRGILQFRDTLRQQSVLTQVRVQDIDLGEVQNLGKQFGLIGDAGFDFGMKLYESSRLIGIGRSLDAESLSQFYRDSALALNMTVDEFGEHFNTLSKDPSFIGFVNTLRRTGGNIQDAVETEMKSRIRMNKILGLSNEEMQQRLNMERQSKWQGVAERFRSKLGAGQLMDLYSSELGLDFTGEQRRIFEQYKADPSLLNDMEREMLNQRILPAITVAPSMIEAKYTDIMNDPTATRLEREDAEAAKGLAVQMMNTWGEMMGGIDKDASARAYSSIAGFGDPATFAQILLDENREIPSKLQAYLDTMTGDTETPVERGKMLSLVQGIYENVSGIAKSGPIKAGLGILGGAGSIFGDMVKMQVMSNMVTGRPLMEKALSHPLRTIGGAFVKTTNELGNTKYALTGFSKGLGTATAALALLYAGKKFGDWIQENQDTNAFAGFMKDLSNYAFNVINHNLGNILTPKDTSGDTTTPEMVADFRRSQMIEAMNVGVTDTMAPLNKMMVDGLSDKAVIQSMAYARTRDEASIREVMATMREELIPERSIAEILESLERNVKVTATSTKLKNERDKRVDAEAKTGKDMYEDRMAYAQYSAVGMEATFEMKAGEAKTSYRDWTDR